VEQPQVLTLDQQFERGQSAELFLRFITDNPYFKSLFSELDDEYTREIQGLDPLKKEEWAILQAKRLALYEPLNRVHMDISIGRRAYDMMQKGKT
jgi:hypothetical protein